MSGVSRVLRDFGAIAGMVALFASVTFLPADTSLSEVEDRGVLQVCIPASYPPLVTGDPEQPGLDIELLTAAAETMGLAIRWHRVPAMGRDFNPRSWRITRAQCQVIAGGVVDTPTTRSFLDVTGPHAETGWVVISAVSESGDAPDLEGKRVGVLPGTSGFDRLALSRYLRARRIEATVVHEAGQLTEGLESGRFDFGVAEALVAERVASDHGWSVTWLPGLPSRYPLVFGLWKGDLTLKRALDDALRTLDENGTADELRRTYLGAPDEPPDDATVNAT